jgi:hypothetical protein
MAQLQNQSIPRDKFLLMSMNLLHRAFIGRQKSLQISVGRQAHPIEQCADGG